MNSRQCYRTGKSIISDIALTVNS